MLMKGLRLFACCSGGSIWCLSQQQKMFLDQKDSEWRDEHPLPSDQAFEWNLMMLYVWFMELFMNNAQNYMNQSIIAKTLLMLPFNSWLTFWIELATPPQEVELEQQNLLNGIFKTSTQEIHFGERSVLPPIPQKLTVKYGEIYKLNTNFYRWHDTLKTIDFPDTTFEWQFCCPNSNSAAKLEFKSINKHPCHAHVFLFPF